MVKNLFVFALPEELAVKGKIKKYKPNSIIVSRGDAANGVYFIEEGVVTGLREYTNGNIYNYFELNSTDGIVGLLEIMAGEKNMLQQYMQRLKLQCAALSRRLYIRRLWKIYSY